MLNELLKLERRTFALDLETTSRKPDDARIIELGFQEWTPDGMVREWSTRLNPGVPIPPDVTEITGITDFDVAARPRFVQIAPNLAKGFSDCDFIGKHIRYDLRVLANEMNRNEIPWSYSGARIICAERIEQIAVPRTLSALYKKYTGKDLEDAHGALPDVRASVEVLVRQLGIWEPLFPRTLDELHAALWPDWIDTEGKFRYNAQGVAIMNFGKHQDLPMNKVPIDYWNFILSPKEQFSPEIKQYAADAKLGKFPSRPAIPKPTEVPKDDN